MKKILIAAFALSVVLSLSGCEDPEKQETTTPAETTVTTTTTTTTTTVSETSAEAAATTAEITAPETTTSRIGGFIVYDQLPEDGDSWEEIGIE